MSKKTRKLKKRLLQGLWLLLSFLGILIIVGVIVISVAAEITDDLEDLVEFWGED